MKTPYDLERLHALRRRGQCPQMPVFVTDSWKWAQRIPDCGALCIRVQSPSDHRHDWSALVGLHCILVEWRGNYAELGQALLSASPSILETFHDSPQLRSGWWCYSRLVWMDRNMDLGEKQPGSLLMRRDALFYRFLRS